MCLPSIHVIEVEEEGVVPCFVIVPVESAIVNQSCLCLHVAILIIDLYDVLIVQLPLILNDAYKWTSTFVRPLGKCGITSIRFVATP